MQNPKFKSLFIKCDCYGHLLEIQKFQYEDNPLQSGLYITIWNFDQSNRPMTWKERLRWCWYILRAGDPWADHIIVSKEKIQQISEYINTTVTNE